MVFSDDIRLDLISPAAKNSNNMNVILVIIIRIITAPEDFDENFFITHPWMSSIEYI